MLLRRALQISALTLPLALASGPAWAVTSQPQPIDLTLQPTATLPVPVETHKVVLYERTDGHGSVRVVGLSYGEVAVSCPLPASLPPTPTQTTVPPGTQVVTTTAPPTALATLTVPADAGLVHEYDVLGQAGHYAVFVGIASVKIECPGATTPQAGK